MMEGMVLGEVMREVVQVEVNRWRVKSVVGEISGGVVDGAMVRNAIQGK